MKTARPAANSAVWQRSFASTLYREAKCLPVEVSRADHREPEQAFRTSLTSEIEWTGPTS